MSFQKNSTSLNTLTTKNYQARTYLQFNRWFLVKFLLFFIVLGTNQFKAQNSLTGSSKYQKYLSILALEEDSARCNQLINYACFVADSLGDVDFSMLIFKRADALLKQKNYPEIQYKLHHTWALRAYLIGQYDLANKLFEKALASNISDNNSELKGKIFLNAGNTLFRLNFYKRSLLYYEEALEIFTKLNDEKRKAPVYNGIASIYMAMGDNKQADLFFDKAAKIYLDNNMQAQYFKTLENKAIVKSNLKDFNAAKVLFLKSFNYLDLKNKKDIEPYIRGCYNLTSVFWELKRWDSCLYFLNKGKKISDSMNLSQQFDGVYYTQLGNYYLSKGKFKKAITCYKKVPLFKLQTDQSVQALYDDIAKVYLRLKQYDSAFVYKDKSMKISDSIYKSELKEQIAFENKKVELLENYYQDQVESAEQQVFLNNLKRRNIILIFVISGLTAIVLLLFLYFRQYRLRIKKEHLQSELDFLRAQMNPHFLFNSINNIYVLLDNDKAKASQILLKFSDLLRYQLYECNVSKIPLSKELQFIENYMEFERLRYSNKIKIGFYLKIDQSQHLLIAPLLIQPFIENAFKHTPKNKNGSSYIDIKVLVNKEKIVFEASNSVDTSQTSDLPGGIGLANVKKRLNLLYRGKYRLDIDSNKNDYKVVLTISLAND